MKRVHFFGAALVAMLTLSFAPSQNLCEGFLPENDMKIPIRLQMVEGGGLNQAQFNAVLDRLTEVYGPIIEAQGGHLSISRQWTNDTVNASAQRFGDTYQLNMYGGLARHPAINEDGFMLVACHETGHHLGGAPKVSGWFSTWASNEGEADYFAGLKCLRRVWTAEDNSKFMQDNEATLDPFMLQKCREAWSTVEEINLCARIGAAGMRVTALFKDLSQEDQEPRYDTPDTHRVSQTDDSHPATQCRLDTYFQSGLCIKSVDDALSDSDVARGACVEADGFTMGVRPRCWYGETP
jgi:hypothetical protein